MPCQFFCCVEFLRAAAQLPCVAMCLRCALLCGNLRVFCAACGGETACAGTCCGFSVCTLCRAFTVAERRVDDDCGDGIPAWRRKAVAARSGAARRQMLPLGDFGRFGCGLWFAAATIAEPYGGVTGFLAKLAKVSRTPRVWRGVQALLQALGALSLVFFFASLARKPATPPPAAPQPHKNPTLARPLHIPQQSPAGAGNPSRFRKPPAQP